MATTSFYAIGETVEISTVVTDPDNGQYIDPLTITLTVTQPDGTEDSVTPVHDSLGHYHGLYTPAVLGRFTFAWVATGGISGSEIGAFDVGSAATQYCTVEDLLLGDLRIPPSVDVDAYIQRAARDIDLALGQRYDTPISTTNPYTVNLLRNVCSDLASAYLIMAQAQGGEDNNVNAYGLFLYNRARNTLDPYRTTETLPGADILGPTTGGGTGPVSIVQEDEESLFAPFKRLTENADFYPVAAMWNDGFQ